MQPKQSIFSELKGKLSCSETMARHVWFRTGGVAELFFTAQDAQDLSNFLQQKPKNMPYFPIGVGSNLLVRDGGIAGIVLKLGKGFSGLDYDAETGIITAGAAVMDAHLARFTQTCSRTGLEFYAGIPGTVGGAVAMNAGAYESDTAACLQAVEIMNVDGSRQWFPSAELAFAYRKSLLPEGAIILQARFATQAGDQAKIAEAILAIQTRRAQTQPIGSRTGGSTFKNPKDGKAWELIEQAGMRGYCVGDAMMSDKHCNFMINKNKASGADLENLGEAVRAQVQMNSGILLEWEIRRVGYWHG